MAKYETKDSGKRAEFSSGMQRDTQDDKPRFDLIMPELIPYDQQLLTRWAELMARGAVKYCDRNWEKAEGEEELNRFKASLFRHFIQYMNGQTDEDHAAAILFNVQGIEYVKWRMQNAKT